MMIYLKDPQRQKNVQQAYEVTSMVKQTAREPVLIAIRDWGVRGVVDKRQLIVYLRRGRG